MDAATPFRRWLCAAGPLVVAAGCAQPDPFREGADRTRAAQDVNRAAMARPQMPADPPAVQGQPVVPAAAAIPSGPPRIKVVAVVGKDHVVTDEEVWEAVRQRMPDYCTFGQGPNGQRQVIRDPEKEKQVYAEELRHVVERELILDEMTARLKKAGKPGLMDEIKEFSGKAADRELRRRKRLLGAQSDEELQEIFASQGLTVPVVRRQLERQMMATEYVRSVLKEKGKAPGLAEVRAYYDAHPDEFRTTDRVKWLDIFVSPNRFPSREAAAAHAAALQRQAAAGADFPALSKEHDHGISGRQGGEGIGQRRGEIRPAELEEVVWALLPGQVSGVVETPAGFHVVKVAEREFAGVRPFDVKTQAEVRDKLAEKLQEREYKRLVEELWRRGVVKVME
jgi:hypothetical protein